MYAATPYWSFRAERPPRDAYRRLRTASLALAVTVAIMFGLAKTAMGEEPQGLTHYVVRPGDTLWTIAAQRHSDTDVRDKVGEIERLNKLSSPVIIPGEELLIPAG